MYADVTYQMDMIGRGIYATETKITHKDTITRNIHRYLLNFIIYYFIKIFVLYSCFVLQ